MKPLVDNIQAWKDSMTEEERNNYLISLVPQQESDDIDQAQKAKEALADEFHAEFDDCDPSGDGLLGKEQFRQFQIAMDDWEEKNGV